MKETTYVKLSSNEKSVFTAEVNKVIRGSKKSSQGYAGKSPKERYRGASVTSFSKNDLVGLCRSIKSSISLEMLPVGINPVSAQVLANISYKLPTYNMIKGKQEMKKNYIEQIMKMNSSSKKISTLIIDDDVDSLIPVDSIFRKYGCKTEQAMNYLDASQKIKDTQADIIILDWRIGDLTGGQLIEQCAKAIAMNENLRNKFLKKPVKIVTYSGDDLSGITFSEQACQFFTYLGQWNKQNMFSEIEEKAVRLMVS